MKDPRATMDPASTMKPQASSAQAEPQSEPRRNPTKSVRVAFGPDLETHIPPRDRSPAPATSHHRSFTTVEHKPPPLTSPPGRPTSSSGENSAVIDSGPRLTSDRSSDSARPTSTLKRAKSDYGPRVGFDRSAIGDDEEDFAMRHGWQEEYTSSEYLKILNSVSQAAAGLSALPCVSVLINMRLCRISTCISQKSVTRQMAFQGTPLVAGQVKIGA